MELRQYLKILRKYLWMILLVCAIGAGSSYYYSSHSRPSIDPHHTGAKPVRDERAGAVLYPARNGAESRSDLYRISAHARLCYHGRRAVEHARRE